jgi:dienelactone hydrolase
MVERYFLRGNAHAQLSKKILAHSLILFRGLCVSFALALSLPLAADSSSFEFTLTAAQGRHVPVLVTHPDGDGEARALIVFSHGANAAPERYTRLFDAWAEGGYVVVAPMHVDSELNPDRGNYDRSEVMLTRLEEFGLLSTGDVVRAAVEESGQRLSDVVIAAGHSYGALIAQVAGGTPLGNVVPLPATMLAARDEISAVVALSPPGPFGDTVTKEDWSLIDRPMLVVTGTTDILPGFMDDWRMHLVSYEAAQGAPAYALVFAGQDHYFNGAFGRPSETLEPDDVRALKTLNITTLHFLDSLLDEGPPTPMQWRALSGDVMEARASAITQIDH